MSVYITESDILTNTKLRTRLLYLLDVMFEAGAAVNQCGNNEYASKILANFYTEMKQEKLEIVPPPAYIVGETTICDECGDQTDSTSMCTCRF